MSNLRNVRQPAVSLVYIENGSRLILPSGQTAKFVRWRVRPVKRGDAAQGEERVAVVRVDGLLEDTEFSVSFMRAVTVFAGPEV
ncbi:hypothetical protein EV686_11099 [Paracandidimonas soli]|uniref:Uncharacterized protein n=1 Tax=Paracandidimonas soli TaxID=1917182 RepID=A0A4R3USQ7_9BURK|nr:hypothetical protein EV686_11099 [Paracandidimonas soli]